MHRDYDTCKDAEVKLKDLLDMEEDDPYTSLEENDYMQINSRNNTIVKYRSDGVRQDIYDSRAKQQSVFDLITPGNIRVVWSGSFGFDLKLYCERSEPKCKTKGS